MDYWTERIMPLLTEFEVFCIGDFYRYAAPTLLGDTRPRAVKRSKFWPPDRLFVLKRHFLAKIVE
jgi:hypothetical protein